MKKIKVGLIGFGLSGRVFHSPLIRSCSQFEIVKVFSSRKSEIKTVLPEAEIASNIHDILEDPLINLVVICGPNYTHYEQCKMALEKGKHVVVEKPFVSASVEGKELIQLAKDRNLIISVFQNRRWDCDFMALKTLIDGNVLGTIKLFESRYDRWRPHLRPNKWKEEPGVATGVLYDLGSHLIDQCVQLFGLPEAIFADLETQRENSGVADYFHLTLKYKEMRAIVTSSSFSLNGRRFSVLGSRANFVKSGLDPQEAMLTSGVDPNSESFGREDPDDFGTLISVSGEGIKDEPVPSPKGCYQEFYQKLAEAICLNDPKLTPVDPLDSLKVVSIIEAAIDSSEQKRWVYI